MNTENATFWEVTKIDVFLYKEGKLVAEGIAYEIYIMEWDEEYEEYDRQGDHGDIIIVDGKEVDADDYDEVEWESESEIETHIDNYQDAEKLLYDITGRKKK